MALKKAVRSSDTRPFKFERKGDTIKGFYLKTSDEIINGSTAKKHVFQTEGGLLSVLGQADMYQQLAGNNCLGKYVEVTFTGNVQKLKGGKTMKLYDVSYDTEQDASSEILAEVNSSEEDPFENEEEEVELPRAAAPAKVVKTPTAAQLSEVQALISKRGR